MTNDDAHRRRSRTVRLALFLAIAAVAVYGSFIFIQYQRSRGLM